MAPSTLCPPTLAEYLDQSIAALQRARAEMDLAGMERAIAAVVAALAAGRPFLVCGNGGSAADAEHIVGELVGRFLRDRRGYKAISLVSSVAAMTAWANDASYDTIFARQVEAYGEPGGVLLGISTSGNSRNVVAAFEAARAVGMTTVALTGEGGGRLKALSDVLLAVPSTHTPYIQQVHVCLYHHLCGQVEARLADARPA